MKKNKEILNFLFYSIAFFILIPNKLKEIPFVILGLFSIYLYIKGIKINFKKYLFLNLFFIVNLISLLYSSNLKDGFTRIECYLPFVYISFSYFILLKTDIKFTKNFLNNWILIFNISNFIFLICFSVYFNYLNLEINYNNIRTILDQIPLINMHPIYLSIMSILGLMTSIQFSKSNFIKGFFIIINIFILLLSGTKATFIGFIVMAFILVLLSKKSKIVKLCLFSFTVLFTISLFAFYKDFKLRFRETILPVSYNSVNPNNSTSVRFAIWNCSINLIEESNIAYGNGIGDVKTLLLDCYELKYPKLDKYYNTHNQYFSIILGTGIIGLICFFAFIIYIIQSGLKSKNKFIITLVIFYLYMFIFENVIERKYGILMFLFFIFFVFNLFQKKSVNELK
jgi:O-antigen ligase